MRLSRSVLIAASAIVSAAASQSLGAGVTPAAQNGPASASFFDPFDRLDNGRWYMSDGWVNGDHQGCTWSRENIAVSNGVLQIHLGKAVDRLRAYRCGELQTKANYGYGVYEARMRTAAGSGLNTAMFTYDGTSHDEIDFEFLGRNIGQVQLNYFLAGKNPHAFTPELGYAAPAAFHDYAFIWLPGHIAWYVDGKLVHEERGATVPTNPGHLIFSLWNGTSNIADWLGPFDTSRTPVLAEVDWAAYTKIGERCRFAASITCKLR